MSWTYLVIAILLDVIATVFMKQSEGFSKLLPSLLAATTFVLSIMALTVALKELQVIAVYAIWVGLGTAVMTVMGVMVFNEVLDPLKLGSLLLVALGVIGLIVATEFAH
jgi:small multidrug resistance pump